MTRPAVAQLIARASHGSFEEEIARDNVLPEQVSDLLDIDSDFRLIGNHSPDNLAAILDVLEKERLVKRAHGKLQITNLGAILFARDLAEFEHLQRKSVRVIILADLSVLANNAPIHTGSMLSGFRNYRP